MKINGIDVDQTSKISVFNFFTQKSSDPSGYYKTPKGFSKHFPKLFEEFSQTQFPLESEFWSFSQKLFHFLQDDINLNLGVCECGKRCFFQSFIKGYCSHCSPSCSTKSNDVQNKIKSTCIKKYGKSSYTKTKECQEKMRQTCLEKYGKENFSQTDEYKTKIKNTCLDLYGVDNYAKAKECQEKMRQTCLVKYNAPYYSQTTTAKEKISQSQFERWKSTTQEDIEKMKKKSKETCLLKYGQEYYALTKEFLEKQYITKSTNHSFNTSKVEIKCKEYLENNNINYKYQYSSDKYPYMCDFYLPDYDLYIEIQAHWSHGGCPFNDKSTECVDKLNIMIEKSKNRPSYIDAINTWTNRDVLKRTTANKNNLNYLEIFSNSIDTVIKSINNKIKELE